VHIAIDPGSPVPPFEQLRSGIAAQVSDGTLPAGTKLPTVRSLAERLGLAANTVARAYRELEIDGVVATEGRRGTFVASTAVAAPPHEVDDLARELVLSARRHGLTSAEALRLVERAWGNG
jgi:DNA-binding transcriptional regulator YhcF (GntR family)